MAKRRKTIRQSVERAVKQLRLNVGPAPISRKERLAYFRDLKLRFDMAQVEAVEGLNRGDFRALDAALKVQREILAVQRVLTERAAPTPTKRAKRKQSA